MIVVTFRRAGRSVFLIRELGLRVNLRTRFHKLLALLFHPALKRFFFGDGLFGGVFADVFGDLHGTEVGAAHGAEVGALGFVLRERLVVVFAGGDGVEAQVELVFPAELAAIR